MARLFTIIASLAGIAAASATAIPLTGCDLSGVKIENFPSALPAPTSPLSFVAIALGTQNYTCTDAGTYTCLISRASPALPLGPGIPDLKAPAFLTTEAIISMVMPSKTSLALGKSWALSFSLR
ncbi:hypothetical protein BKA70DRAFT_1287107 [Coprinopsis sp. MPI-PUGE-AT-0042]|nr:hypothetical protein BKA70DRAFT_1287107 [Coprinopsis sp. MPI-PUGE-AT-0042]